MDTETEPAPRNDLKERGVFFYVHDQTYTPEYFHYAVANLARGLKDLGIPLFSNRKDPMFQPLEWKAVGMPLFVFSLTEHGQSPELMQAIVEAKAPQKVILSMADTVSTMCTPPEIPSLMTHENRFYRFKVSKRFPWAFGLSQKRIAATAGGLDFDRRENKLLCNFRPSHQQDVRRAMDLSLIPHLEKYFAIDREISDAHFEKLQRYQGCLAYGGYFHENLCRHPHFAQDVSLKRLNDNVAMQKDVVVLRWDSWRMWESLAAGCLTFQLDFEEHGFELPVKPVGWEHYIPISMADPRATVEHLMDVRSCWAEIAANGQAWALKHYSSKAVAQRFIDWVAMDAWRSSPAACG